METCISGKSALMSRWHSQTPARCPFTYRGYRARRLCLRAMLQRERESQSRYPAVLSAISALAVRSLPARIRAAIAFLTSSRGFNSIAILSSVSFSTERTYVEINVGSQGTACREIILPQLEKLQIPSATSRSSFSLLRF
jgi:hypothetical protein